MTLRSFLRSAIKEGVHEDEKKFVDMYNRTYNKRLTTPSAAIRQLVADHIDELKTPNEPLTKLSIIVKSLYGNISTQEALFANIRNIIREKFGVDSKQAKMSMTKMGVDVAEKQASITEQRLKLVRRNENLTQFDVNDILRIIDSASSSQDVHDNIIAVMLAVGSRSYEAIKLSKFKPTANPYEVEVTGFAKTSKTEAKMLIRPTIKLTASEVIALVNNYREKLNLTGTAAAVTNRYNATINRRIKKLFGRDDVTSHTLRKIYGNLSYEMYANKSKISLSAWLKNVLGHDDDNMTASLNYSQVSVTDSTLKPPSGSDTEKDLKLKLQRVEQQILELQKVADAIRTQLTSEFKAPPQTQETKQTIRGNIKGVRDGKVQERLAITVSDLKSQGIPITWKTLQSYGYSKRAIEEFQKKK